MFCEAISDILVSELRGLAIQPDNKAHLSSGTIHGQPWGIPLYDPEHYLKKTDIDYLFYFKGVLWFIID